MNTAKSQVEQLSGNYLSVAVIDSDQASISVRFYGSVRCHMIGVDADGDFEYHYEDVDQEAEFQPGSLISQTLQEAVLALEAEVVEAVAEGRDWRDTCAQLEYELTHK